MGEPRSRVVLGVNWIAPGYQKFIAQEKGRYVQKRVYAEKMRSKKRWKEFVNSDGDGKTRNMASGTGLSSAKYIDPLSATFKHHLRKVGFSCGAAKCLD